ncbi:MAG TPA: type II and III secretion system protein [Pyrinomonadaceae bacterium]|nr:type II and III secretion system protein [Pyrinomonadaceae bacterium]
MKRIREFIFLSLVMFIVFGFFADYVATASAPGVRDVVEPDPQFATGGARASYIDQIIRTSTLPAASLAATVESADDILAELNNAVPAVEEPEPGVISTHPASDELRELQALTLQTTQAVDGNYCDPNFVGQPITFSQTAQLRLEDLLEQIHNRFGINFLMGPNLRELPINIKTGSIPWNVLLKSQLFVSGVRARCINRNTIELVQNVDLPKLQDGADAVTRFVKLKFLQRTSGGTVDLAGRSQGSQQGGCSDVSFGTFARSGGVGETASVQLTSRFDKLIIEIEKILGIRSMTESSVGGGGNDGGGGRQQTEEKRTNRFVTQIPGRNILVIRATDEEHALIDQIISRADRPPFQVVIKGLVYSANQDRLRDIGVQTTILGDGNDGVSGGIFGHTLGNGTLFDFTSIIGTFEFNVQATALQQNGVITVKSRPFATVLDGLCTTLEVGRQLPIVIDSSLGGVGTVTFVDATNNLAVTPYVIDDDAGNPLAVTLDLRLAANDVDSSVSARGVPAISKRSVQTQLLLGEDKTAILGGFTVDQDSKTISKTPGLGDIPIIGELFKRRVRDTRINRLYFALSVSVIPYGEAIEPVVVPGATTNPPSLTPEQLDRAKKGEPKQVVPPKKDN